MSRATVIGCGGGSNDTSSCGGTFETSCDLPSDNGAHTCYDVGGQSTEWFTAL